MKTHPAIRLVVCAIGLFVFGAADAQQITVQQFGVTAANANGNALYNLTTTSTSGAIATGTQVLNTDAANYGQFDAVARVPNSVTSALDLVVADFGKSQIVRYPGPGPASYQTATPIYAWTHGSGPKFPTALANDVAGNIYMVANSLPLLGKPSLWVLPFNATTGAYGAPILIDNSFGGAKCQFMGDLVVAGTAATVTAAGAQAWNVGDLITLCGGDGSSARLMMYSHAQLAGVIANPGTPLTGPTSIIAVNSQLPCGIPAGIDMWPADATHGVSLLITTVSGRVMRYDSALYTTNNSTNPFTTDFAANLGPGLLKLKVGTYATITYAFVAQSKLFSGGQILQFTAPPAGGTNTPASAVAVITTGVNTPLGLAATSSASVPVSSCLAPSTCSPLGPQLVTQITVLGNTSPPPNAPFLEESCVVQSDPRVTVSGTSWSCAGGTLDIAQFCPGFPSTVLPASMCGHSGPTGSGFVIVKGTAKTVDQAQYINNNFLQEYVDPDQPLPGPLNLVCPQEQVFAWAPRSDLPLIEGTVPEDAALANTFIDLSGFCDKGGGNTHLASMLAYGLGLNTANGMPSGQQGLNVNGVPGFVNNKFGNLNTTISNASAQIDPTVYATLQSYVAQAMSEFNTGVANSDTNAIGCAMNTLASADGYVRNSIVANPASAFTGVSPPGNPNPAGDVDGRLANLFFTIDLYFLNPAQPQANKEWPTVNVPPCMTFTASPTTVIAGNAATLNWSPATLTAPLSFPANWCTMTATDGTPPSGQLPGSGSGSTGTLNTQGTYTAFLSCSSATDNSNTITSYSQTNINVVTLSSISISPSSPSVPDGGTLQMSATGTYSDGATTKDLTASAAWQSSDSTVATVSGGLVNCVAAASGGGSARITATIGSVVSPQATVTCQAPVLTSIAVNPASATVAAGGTAAFTATGTYSFGSTQDLTASAVWQSSNTAVATVSGGLVTCVTTASNGGSALISATVGNIPGSTATLSCQAPALQAIAVTPSSVSVPTGGTLALTATATYSYGPPQVVTSTATWLSSNTSIATVAAGLVTCVGKTGGPVMITSSVGGVQSSAVTLTCQAPTLTSISVTPSRPSAIICNGNLQLTATGTYSNGLTQNLTSSAAWSSSAPNVAKVSSSGIVMCQLFNSPYDSQATISAAVGGVSGSVSVTCGAFRGHH